MLRLLRSFQYVNLPDTKYFYFSKIVNEFKPQIVNTLLSANKLPSYHHYSAGSGNVFNCPVGFMSLPWTFYENGKVTQDVFSP